MVIVMEDNKGIFELITKGDLSKVRDLLNANSELVYIKDKDGDTPLHFAAMVGHTDIAKLLIDSGADVNKINKDGDSPLHYAAGDGHTAVVNLLIESGAEINLKTRND